jgi:hypothetical protein
MIRPERRPVGVVFVVLFTHLSSIQRRTFGLVEDVSIRLSPKLNILFVLNTHTYIILIIVIVFSTMCTTLRCAFIHALCDVDI